MRKLYKNIYSISSKIIFSKLSKSGKKITTAGCKSTYINDLKIENHLICKLDKYIIQKSNCDLEKQLLQQKKVYLAIRISKKNIKLAVSRNLMKRRFLHIIRVYFYTLFKCGYYVFYINKIMSYEELLHEMKLHINN